MDILVHCVIEVESKKIELILVIYQHLTCKNKADDNNTKLSDKGSQEKEK